MSSPDSPPGGAVSDHRLRRLERRVSDLEQKSREARAAFERDRARLKRASALLRRSVLSPDVVRDIFQLRARTIGARSRHADALASDARFQDLSPAYKEAISCATQPHAELATTTLQGLTWWVPVPSSLRRSARERFVAKQRFPYRIITQTRELSVGPVFLDIGAKTGRMSIGRVFLGDFQCSYCAEPDPLNFPALVRNIASNGLRGLVLADRVAIGSANGSSPLRHAKYPGGHRLVASGQPDEHSIEVPCSTLDAWCRHLSIDPALVTYVKVDTQGWEVHVLRGAAQLLEHQHIAWQIEVAPTLLDAAGTSVRELYELCAARFVYFIDLRRGLDGPRARPTGELARALGDLRGEETTDILLFNTVPPRVDGA